MTWQSEGREGIDSSLEIFNYNSLCHRKWQWVKDSSHRRKLQNETKDSNEQREHQCEKDVMSLKGHQDNWIYNKSSCLHVFQCKKSQMKHSIPSLFVCISLLTSTAKVKRLESLNSNLHERQFSDGYVLISSCHEWHDWQFLVASFSKWKEASLSRLSWQTFFFTEANCVYCRFEKIS